MPTPDDSIVSANIHWIRQKQTITMVSRQMFCWMIKKRLLETKILLVIAMLDDVTTAFVKHLNQVFVSSVLLN